MSKQEVKCTQLETAMFLLLDTFQKYAKEDGNECSLSKAEAKKMIEKELPQLCTEAKDQVKVNDLFQALDADKSGDIDFMEFMILVSSLLCAFHGLMVSKCKK